MLPHFLLLTWDSRLWAARTLIDAAEEVCILASVPPHPLYEARKVLVGDILILNRWVECLKSMRMKGLNQIT